MKKLKFLDDFMLKLSSTQLGQTDYDKEKVYDKEEEPADLKKLAYVFLAMAVIIGVGALIMFLSMHFSSKVVVALVFICAIVGTIVMMGFRK